MNHPLQVEILRNWQAAQEILPEWSELWNRCPEATPFQRPEWLYSWMRVFVPSKPLILLFRTSQILVGLAPLLIYQSGPDQAVGLMGGGISDYLDVLIVPPFGDEVLLEMWRVIGCESGWNLLDFSDLPPHSPVLRAPFPGKLVQPHDVCPALKLPARRDDFRSTIPGRQARNLRNAASRLARAGGGQIEIASRENLEPSLQAMFQLHHRRWSMVGEDGVLGDAKVQQFHRLAAPKLLEAGVLRLYSLIHQQRRIATLYAFWAAHEVYCYLQAFDPEFGFLSPGTQILGAVLEDAIAQQKTNADFLRGREAYKYNWGAVDRLTYRLRALRSPATPASYIS
jgi:CelD/BcsL family acetyltransferase involved in cellulose biosynthesis